MAGTPGRAFEVGARTVKPLDAIAKRIRHIEVSGVMP